MGDELARVRSGEATAELIAAVRKCFSLGDARNPHQDIDFAVQQLTEMAVRALSPSTNDPYTAKNALAELAVGLVPLVQRNAIPEGRADEHGTLRLLVHRTAPATVVDTVFDAMRIYAVPSPVAVTATIDLARRVGAAALYQQIRDALLRQLTHLGEAYSSSGARPEDIEARSVEINAGTAGPRILSHVAVTGSARYSVAELDARHSLPKRSVKRPHIFSPMRTSIDAHWTQVRQSKQSQFYGATLVCPHTAPR